MDETETNCPPIRLFEDPARRLMDEGDILVVQWAAVKARLYEMIDAAQWWLPQASMLTIQGNSVMSACCPPTMRV